MCHWHTLSAMAPSAKESASWPVRRVESFGGVVVRTGADGLEVALIRPMSEDDKVAWALPKGAKEAGETPEDAALREVREETGLEAEVVESIEPITYWFAWAPDKLRYRKTVHFFLMRHLSGEPTPDAVEVAEVRFVPLVGADKTATYSSERKVLKAAADLAATW